MSDAPLPLDELAEFANRYGFADLGLGVLSRAARRPSITDDDAPPVASRPVARFTVIQGGKR